MYHHMLEAAACANISVIPTTTRHQLLALLLVHGDEPFVFNDRLKYHVEYAARMAGIDGGKAPDPVAVRAIRAYVKELRSDIKPGWVHWIEEKYGITFPEYHDPHAGRDEYWKELVQKWQSMHT